MGKTLAKPSSIHCHSCEFDPTAGAEYINLSRCSALCRRPLPSPRRIFFGVRPMANTNLFASLKSLLTRADATNEAGGVAYRMPPRHALAQLAATGCFNGTYYSDGAAQLAALLQLVAAVD